MIGRDDITVTAMERLDLTNAQKRDKRFYSGDSTLLFNRNTSGFKSGDTGRLLGITDKHLLIEASGRIRPVLFKHVDRMTVCQPKELSLSAGDRLQLKANARTAMGADWLTGSWSRSNRFTRMGASNWGMAAPWPRNYRQFGRGYAVTSYAAQGQNVDYVLFSDSGIRAATNDQQWYVTFPEAEGHQDFHSR